MNEKLIDKLLCHRILIRVLVQNETINPNVFVPIYQLKNQKDELLGEHYFLMTNFRGFFISKKKDQGKDQQKDQKRFELYNQWFLLSEFYNQKISDLLIKRKLKNRNDSYFHVKPWNMGLLVKPSEENMLRIAFDDIIKDRILEEELKYKKLVADNQLYQDYLYLVPKKISEEFFWNNRLPELLYLQQQKKAQNTDQLRLKAQQLLPQYPVKYPEHQKLFQKLYYKEFQDDIIRNLDLPDEIPRQLKIIIPKELRKNKQQLNQIIENMAQYIDLNDKLQQQYHENFGVEIADIIAEDPKLPFRRILKREFQDEIQQNEGYQIEQVYEYEMEVEPIKQNKKRFIHDLTWINQKQMILNQFQQPLIFQNSGFEDLKLSEQIIQDYKAACSVKPKQLTKLEEQHKEYFKLVRTLTKEAITELRYFYSLKIDDPKKEQTGIQLKQLRDDIRKQIEIQAKKIQQLEKKNQNQEEFKLQILEDLQKQIEKGLNE
ncbi:hypothetical protein pb186bvf_002185 [Paramecium bursaria]